MRKYYSIPLLFFCFASIMGLFLRWQFIAPTPGVRYQFFLHGHSHVMFLGWVFNVLYLAFTEQHVALTDRIPYLRLFVVLQALVLAMMISFPLQGYGLYSIIFSTLHTVAVMIFIPFFFRRTRDDNRVSSWFARVALIFFLISTAGPFALGYLMANGFGQTVWYNLSIYYYLHFQYNGFFFFGILSLLFHMIEQKQIPHDRLRALRFGKWMAIACIPAYALSTLYTLPGLLFNIIGAAAAIIQIIAAYFLAVDKTLGIRILPCRLSPFEAHLTKLVFVAFVLKLVLQLASAYPDVATLAHAMRPVTIAYLHLVLVGVISLFLFIWYLDRHLLRMAFARHGITFFLIGFVGSQLCLIIMPWASRIISLDWSPVVLWIFSFSLLMTGGAVLLSAGFRPGADESQRLP